MGLGLGFPARGVRRAAGSYRRPVVVSRLAGRRLAGVAPVGQPEGLPGGRELLARVALPGGRRVAATVAPEPGGGGLGPAPVARAAGAEHAVRREEPQPDRL